MQHISGSIFRKDNIAKYLTEYKNNIPTPHLVIDNFLKTSSAEAILTNFKFNKNWINYSFINNKEHYGLSDKNYMNEVSKEVFKELASKDFTDFISKVTGLKNIFLDESLDSGGLAQCLRGGKLNIHTDFNSHVIYKKWKRMLNILIYLNKDWLDKYKGNLEFWDEKVKYPVKSIEPIFNRFLLFRTDKKSYHGYPDIIDCPPEMSRKCINAWYFIEEEQSLKLYPTKYTPRPKDSFFYKLLIYLDTFLTKIFSFLKRNNLITNEFASKIFNLFK